MERGPQIGSHPDQLAVGCPVQEGHDLGADSSMQQWGNKAFLEGELSVVSPHPPQACCLWLGTGTCTQWSLLLSLPSH